VVDIARGKKENNQTVRTSSRADHKASPKSFWSILDLENDSEKS